MNIVKVTSENKMAWPNRKGTDSRFKVRDWLIIDSEGIVRGCAPTKTWATKMVETGLYF